MFEVAKVQSEDDLREVGAFRYKCYLSGSLISPRPEQLLLDEFDFIETAQIYMVRLGDRIVGTIRLHILEKNAHRSATMTAFSDVLMPKIRCGLKLIDGARFAVASDLGALRFSIARQTLRLYSNFAKTHSADYGVAAVQDTQVEFYRRLYGFTKISEPRNYSHLNKKLALMGVDLRQSEVGVATKGNGHLRSG